MFRSDNTVSVALTDSYCNVEVFTHVSDST